MIFVTAIYNNLYHSSFGGRLNRDNHYLHSLKCLSKMDIPIICYTSAADEPEILVFLETHNISNVTLEIFELNTMEYHDQITKLKKINKRIYDQDNIWANRCVELMWMKIYWLQLISDKHKNEKIYWIDAGLSHNGIFPKKFRSIPLDDIDHVHIHDLAFNDKLVNRLNNMPDDKLFIFYCTNRQHSYPELYSNTKTLPGSVVAGLFGGSVSAIQFLKREFDVVIKYILDKDTLLPEELIYTLIYQNHPDEFNIFEFDTWYHEDWDCFESGMKSFSSFFE